MVSTNTIARIYSNIKLLYTVLVLRNFRREPEFSSFFYFHWYTSSSYGFATFVSDLYSNAQKKKKKKKKAYDLIKEEKRQGVNRK